MISVPVDFAKLTLNFEAALCALRVIKKVPDLADHFTTKAKNLLTDRNHGVLLTSITLVTEMCQSDPVVLEEFRNVCFNPSSSGVTSADTVHILGSTTSRAESQVASNDWIQPRT